MANSTLARRKFVPEDWLGADGTIDMTVAHTRYFGVKIKWSDGDSGHFDEDEDDVPKNRPADVPAQGVVRRMMDDTPEGRTESGNWVSDAFRRYIHQHRVRFMILPVGTVNAGNRFLSHMLMTDQTGAWCYTSQMMTRWGLSCVYEKYRPLSDPFRVGSDSELDQLSNPMRALLQSCLEQEAYAREHKLGMWSPLFLNHTCGYRVLLTIILL